MAEALKGSRSTWSLRSLMRSLRSALVRRYWDRAHAAGGVTTWMAEPACRRRINRRVTGDAGVWPMEWLAEHLRGGPTMDRCLSLGCGTGALERDLVAKGIARRVFGVDSSPRALELAEAAARAEGMTGIEYVRADLETAELPDGEFDAAFCHQSLHHLLELEAVSAKLSEALVGPRLLVIDEYTGPARSEWPNEAFERILEIWERLPDGVQRNVRLRPPSGRRDPSEAIRSSSILPVLRAEWTELVCRPYGGQVLAVIYPNLELSRCGESERAALLDELVELEEAELEERSFYTFALFSSPPPGEEA